MTIISPSLLSCDFLNIELELSHFQNIDNIWFHLDIMDGHFVPNMTFGPPIIKKIIRSTNIKCDAHFMVTNPDFYLESLKDSGLHNFTFHLEATDNAAELIQKAKQHFPSVGISIKPKTDLALLNHEILNSIDLLLVMSVEPGFGGQSFIESTYERLSSVQKLKHENQYQFKVQVDGGVNDSNARKIIDHGANNLVAGSFVFKLGSDHYSTQIEKLRTNE